VERDNVTFREQCVQIDHLDAENFFKARAEIRVARDNAHFESFSPKGSGTTDSAEAHDAHRHFREPGNIADRATIPELKRGANGALDSYHPAITGEHQADGMVGDFVDAIIGHVANGDAARAGDVDIDRIESDAAANDYFAAFSFADEVSWQGDFMKNDDGVRVLEAAAKLFILMSLKTMNSSETVQFALFDVSGRGEIIGNDDFVHGERDT
jgi:hypothetical protein